jgi:4-hydroxybenzoate polyprenyltransferase
MTSILKLLRPQQWVKNLFVFLPLFFDRHLFDVEYLLPCVLVFFAFCFAASGIYCLNDIIDVEADRKHPEKCKRPIASGAVSQRAGYIIMAVCFIISLALLAFIHRPDGRNGLLFLVVGGYVVMNIAYSLKLKQLAIIDVFIIAIGFVLRVLAGGMATGIFLSHWIVLLTFLLTLFLAFAKRRDDVVALEKSGVAMRQSVNRYNLPFMNLAISIIASITMVCYIMYSVSPRVVERFNSPYVYLTSLFVLAGIIRYLQITVVDMQSGSPTKVLLKDRFIQGCVICWLVTFALILYL